MKGWQGLKSVCRLCRFLSKSGEGGIGVGRSVPQLPRQICFEGSSLVDDPPLDLLSTVGEELLNKRVEGWVLSSSLADLQSPNLTISLARSRTSFSSLPSVTSLGFSPVLSRSSSAQIFNTLFRVSAFHFATLRDVWQEGKEEEEGGGGGHGKQGANESWIQRQREIQTTDTGGGATSQKPFNRDKVSESEILIGNKNAIKSSQDNELGSAREEARRELGWSEVGWNRAEVLNWPNFISMTRLLCGPLLSWMILHELWGPAFVGLVIAGISDWLDGYVARKMDINSVLGSYLDPVADKFLVGSVAISMAYMGLLHPGLVGLIVARDGVLMGGAFIYRAYSLRWQWNDWQEFFRIGIGGAGKVEPLFISKVNTVFQLALVGVALLQPALSIEDTYSILPVLSWSVVVTTSISWVAYVYIYLKKS
ncbi:unnamed protein product [Calypogeia fissa]